MAQGSARTFKVHACVGRGGYGEVYRATMFADGQAPLDVAVKVLHTDIDSSSQPVQRLRDERRMLAAVRHESILAVHDLVVIEGRIGLVTEWVEGQDLNKCNRGDAPISARAVVEVIGRMADALHTAHHAEVPGRGSLGLIHRDVKPSNIRIGRNATSKLLDFGIARAEHLEREAKTSPDAVFGSFPYIPPERFLHAVSAAEGDVYALGATLFEGIARDRLWRLPLREIYAMVRNRVRFGRELDARLPLLPDSTPSSVRELVREMVAWDPDDRPTAEAVRDRCRVLVAQMDGPDLLHWCRDHDWPELRVLPGLLSGRVFVEDAIDPLAADNVGRELEWDANDQPMTVNIRGFDPPTVLRTPPPANRHQAETVPPGATTETAHPAGLAAVFTTPDPETPTSTGWFSTGVRLGLLVGFVVGAMALVFVFTFSLMLALLQSYGAG